MQFSRAYGHACALRDQGAGDYEIKVACAQYGLDPSETDYIVKTAFGGMLANGLRAGLTWLGRNAGRLGTKALRYGTNPGTASAMGHLAQGASRLGGKALLGTRNLLGGASHTIASQGLPKALLKGGQGFGQGLLFGGGKGLGSAVGKGLFAAGTVSAVGNMLSGNQAPALPQPYGGALTRSRMRQPTMMSPEMLQMGM